MDSDMHAKGCAFPDFIAGHSVQPVWPLGQRYLVQFQDSPKDY